MSDVVIRVEHLSKSYQYGAISHGTLTKDLQSWWARVRGKDDPNTILSHSQRSGQSGQRFWALQDVSFDVKQGEIVGIIGRNGAGKSTLLKILSEITTPTKGSVKLKGRVGSLLEVGTGFHPELTGRENIFLNGAILGMTKAEIRKKFDEIVDFAEIEEFIDTPVKRYSSGMHVRLAFAVAAHLEPEILLVDEVLAVGDSTFQRKCLGKMQDVVKHGRTVMFVSHSMSAIKQLCPICLCFEEGRILKTGETEDVITTYLQQTLKEIVDSHAEFEEDPSKEFQLRAVQLLTPEGYPRENFECDLPIIIECMCQVHTALPGLYGYLAIARGDGTVVMVSDSFDTTPNPLDSLSVGIHNLRILIPARSLGPGDYYVSFGFASSFSIKNFNVDAPGTVCRFHLDDFTSSRGNARGGYFSTRLSWKVLPS